MEVLDYQFPKVAKLEFAFSTFDTPPVLLKEAKEKGFYNADTPANKMFNKWFFVGLETTPEFKKGVDEEKAQKAMNWAVCYMRSFAPKHEQKEAVCALVFDAALDLGAASAPETPQTPTSSQ